jgi:hypothetical protein|eukprot:scaffold6180_cov194-Alexandrium_tamarense.AAC.6
MDESGLAVRNRPIAEVTRSVFFDAYELLEAAVPEMGAEHTIFVKYPRYFPQGFKLYFGVRAVS